MSWTIEGKARKAKRPTKADRATRKNPVTSGLLRMRREVLALSQRDLAKLLGHSDPGTVNAYETGRRVVHTWHQPKLCDLLEINPHQLKLAMETDQLLASSRMKSKGWREYQATFPKTRTT